MTMTRWTTKDLLTLELEEGNRYEIIDGELFVSTQPHWNHQIVSLRIGALLDSWSLQANSGTVIPAPGIIFDDGNNVAPDVVWISNATLAISRQIEDAGKLYVAPELVVEILSPGNANASRDRDLKLELYDQRGVSEYWIVDWPTRQIEVYRRHQPNQELDLAQTLGETDNLQSPLLPGFSCQISQVFRGLL